MDLSCVPNIAKFYSVLSSDGLTRVKVKKAIHFGPVNQRTYPTVLSRMELGLRIATALDGYWAKNSSGEVYRVALLKSSGQKLTLDQAVLNIEFDLGVLNYSEVWKLYQTLPGLCRFSSNHVLT